MSALARLGLFLLSFPIMLGAADNGAMHLKVVAVRSDNGGTVTDLAKADWKVKVGGRDHELTAQRGPTEISSEQQRWVLVFLPIGMPQMRKLALHSAVKFLESLPEGDRALVVVRNAKGLECLTPGFTSRPSLWTQALNVLTNDLPAGLLGNSSATFALPPSPENEPVEGKETLRAFASQLQNLDLKRQQQDAVARVSLLEQYPTSSLGGYAESAKQVLGAMESLGDMIAKVQGEKQIIVFSRGEVDDLANPVWPQLKQQIRWNAVSNPQLQIDLMTKDVTLAREHLKIHFTRLGLTLHSVGGTSVNYSGAFAEAATASGGQSFRFEGTLPDRLPQVLGSWAAHYELVVPVPADLKRPQSIEVSVKRPGVRVIAPTLQ